MWDSILSGMQGVGNSVSNTMSDAWKYMTEDEKKEVFGQIAEFNNDGSEFADFGSAPTGDYNFSMSEPVKTADPAPTQGYNFSTEGLGADQLAKDVGWNAEKATADMKFMPDTYEGMKAEGSDWSNKALSALKAMGGMAGGGSAPPPPSRSGGFQVQTRDEYAEAMKALVDKYGQFMFNKQF